MSINQSDFYCMWQSSAISGFRGNAREKSKQLKRIEIIERDAVCMNFLNTTGTLKLLMDFLYVILSTGGQAGGIFIAQFITLTNQLIKCFYDNN